MIMWVVWISSSFSATCGIGKVVWQYIHLYHPCHSSFPTIIIVIPALHHINIKTQIYMCKNMDVSIVQDNPQLSAFSSQQVINHLQVALDEVEESTDVAVDTGVAGLGAALAPGDDTDKGAGGVVADGTTRVTLAGVLATLIEASAEHGVGDLAGAVGRVARVAADDGDGDLEEVLGDAAALGGGAPIVGRLG
jgi:hypothetical protein